MPEEGGTRSTPIPRAVWLVVALHVSLMVSYTLLVPTYRAPDEALHVDLILATQEEFRYPALGDRFIAPSVRVSMALVHLDRLQTPHLTAVDAVPRRSRPPFGRLARGRWGAPNYLSEHPPLYYLVQSAVSRGAQALTGGASAWSWDRSVALLRLTGVALMALLPLMAYATAQRFGCTHATCIGAALFPLLVPELSHIGGSVNNDVLLVPLFGVLTVLLARVMTGDLSWRTAILTGAVGGLALLTKGFALIMPAWFAFAYLTSRRSRRVRVGSVAMRLAVVGAVSFLVGGWWWARNLIVYGVPQPSLHDVGLGNHPEPPAGFEPDPVWWLGRFAGAIVERFWAWIGGYGGRLPWPVIVALTAVTATAVIVAFVRSKDSRRRLHLGVLLFPIVAILGIVGPQAFRGYAESGLTPAMQGRYLFAGVVGLAAVVAIGLAFLIGRHARIIPVIMLVAVAVTQTLAFVRVIDSAWGPEGSSMVEHVRAALAWSPWPPSVSLAMLASTVVVGVALWVELVLRPRRAAS